MPEYTFIGEPIAAAELQKIQDENGLFHVEFPMSIEQFDAYMKRNGGTWDMFVEDMIIKSGSMCDMTIQSSEMHDLRNGKLIMRVDGHVVPEFYFQGVLHGRITIALKKDISDDAKSKDDLALKAMADVRRDIQRIFGDDAVIEEDGYSVVWR